MTETSIDTLCAIHSAPEWLPQTQTWMHNQLRYLPASVETHVVCETVQNLDQFPVDNLHVLADSKWRHAIDRVARKLGLRRELGHLVRVAKAEGADVVHSHFGHIGWRDAMAVERLGVGHLVTFYGQDATFLPKQDPVWIERYREMFDSVALVLAEGAHFARTIRGLGCPEEKLRVQHLGVELGRIEFRPRGFTPKRPLRVLLAGSFAEKKGMPYALEALARLRADHDVKITIVGDATPCERQQAQKRQILDVIERNDLDVDILGFQPHRVLFEQAYEHDLFLSPSVVAEDGDSEGGAPVTILEMAASGMPVVSTTHCDIPEVLGASGAELLADERDVEGLVTILQRCLSEPSIHDGLVRDVRAHLEREYDATRQGERLAEIYASIAR